MSTQVASRIDWKIVALIGAIPLLGGCMPAVHMAGEFNSIAQVQYAQSAVLEVKVVIEGAEHTIRAPAKCRSFVHPIGGMRVTRQDVDVFEYATNKGERQFFHIPYGCGLADANVSLTSASYVTQYVVAETPELLIRERRAIPAEDPRSQGASVILLSKKVAEEGTATNVTPSTNLIRGLQSGMSADQRYLQSVSYFELPAAPSDLPHAVWDRIAGAREPLVLDDETRKLLVPALRQLPSSHYVAGDLGYWQRQLSAAYLSEHNEFVADPITTKRGERTYYFVPKARDCGLSKVPCRTYELSYRFRNVVTNGPRPIYDPTHQILYVPIHIGLTYSSKVSG